MTRQQPCPICLDPALRETGTGDHDVFTCPSCGQFGITAQAVEELDNPGTADRALNALQAGRAKAAGLVVIREDDLR